MIGNEVEPKHCDEYIRDKTQPKCLRKFLLFKRTPAIWQCKWVHKGRDIPMLFATYKIKDGPGGRKGKTKRVRVVMASRFGDVGITTRLQNENGYELRVSVENLTNFSETEKYE